MSERFEYEALMESLLALWQSRLDALRVTAYARARFELHGPIQRWNARGESALAKLAELKAAPDAAWLRLRNEMEDAWQDLVGEPA